MRLLFHIGKTYEIFTEQQNAEFDGYVKKTTTVEGTNRDLF